MRKNKKCNFFRAICLVVVLQEQYRFQLCILWILQEQDWQLILEKAKRKEEPDNTMVYLTVIKRYGPLTVFWDSIEDSLFQLLEFLFIELSILVALIQEND